VVSVWELTKWRPKGTNGLNPKSQCSGGVTTGGLQKRTGGGKGKRELTYDTVHVSLERGGKRSWQKVTG